LNRKQPGESGERCAYRKDFDSGGVVKDKRESGEFLKRGKMRCIRQGSVSVVVCKTTEQRVERLWG